MCRYHLISASLLDIAPLLGCPLTLPLHDFAFDDVLTSRENVLPAYENLTPTLQNVVFSDVKYVKMT